MRDRVEKKANGDCLDWRRLTFTHERTHTHLGRSLKFVVTHWKQYLRGTADACQSDYLSSLWNHPEEVEENPILLPVTVMMCPDAATDALCQY